ncbi:MAG: hypothetical protein IJ703_06170 [Eubacterium sp.]|nr:hypothetical protein [Eubacterium sp.]
MVDEYSYEIDNPRSQNDGIAKHFDYDALITGTSMTNNFKTSEMDMLFNVHSIKLPYSGGTYKEVNDNVINAIEHNKDLRYVVRGLDIGKIVEDKDNMRTDLGDYPTYLFDDNIFNDVNYIFNRDVIFNRIYPMIDAANRDDFTPGITSFDSYSNWMSLCTFGMNTVKPKGVSRVATTKQVHLSDKQKEMLLENVRVNAASVAAENPDIDFYYFLTPYSAIWWLHYVNNGEVYMQIEAERLLIEELLKYDNIKLFGFGNLPEITADINNYKDATHYGQWINSLMLKYMHDEKYLLTSDNYEEYLDEELNLYLTFDYASLNDQVDYENDYYAEALLNEEIKGIKPLVVEKDCLEKTEAGKFELSVDVTDYDYLVFYGQKIKEQGQLMVCIFDQAGTKVDEFLKAYNDIDNEKHQYLIDVSSISGNVRIVFSGGYIDDTESIDSEFIIHDITLY